MQTKFSTNRYKFLFFFGVLYMGFSFLLRLIFALWVKADFDWSIGSASNTFLFGFIYDFVIFNFFGFFVSLYYLILPNRFVNSLVDKGVNYFLFTLYFIITYFTFFAEVTFWDEFKSKFNFIAVDYLIYTYEVVKNIQESYPLPLLIGGIVLIIIITYIIAFRLNIISKTFESRPNFITKLSVFGGNVLVIVLSLLLLTNNSSSNSSNRYNNEISKDGIYSFFAAFRNNHLIYDEHYETMPIANAFAIVKEELKDSKTVYLNDNNPIRRKILATNPEQIEQKPNVIFVMMESMSAGFLDEQVDGKSITPNLNQLASDGIFFANMYANGTRTVRGMEAVTLSIPPTPGNSIVKRVDNQNLYTIANVFKSKGYQNSFFYGGDGYFDNMNAFFGGNGFDIYDRGRGSILSDKINTNRFNIDDDEVNFENAWGIADTDIFTKVLKVADEKANKETPFFAFVMTTSNHKPYTYPEGKIDIPSGTGRSGAVKFADYAIGDFLAKAKTKPWFANTVFVFVADHCASSAGRDAIDIKNHHIPAIVYNLKTKPKEKVMKEVSQIDIFPTLFSLLNWEYISQFYGRDVFDPMYKSNVFVGTYIKLGMKVNNEVEVLSDQKKNNTYLWTNDHLVDTAENVRLKNLTIANYQSADYLFANHLLNAK